MSTGATISRRQAMSIGAAGLVVAGLGAQALPASATIPRRLPGRMVGVAGGGFYDLAPVRRFARATATPVEFCLPLFSDVADGLSGARLASVQAAGYTPLVTWSPVRASVGSIAAGEWDAVIRQAARWTRGIPLRIRFGHEMNGMWQRTMYDQPAAFVAAWRRAHDLFRDVGNTAEWVWSPNISGSYVRSFERFFPGDDYVAYVGLDGYATQHNGYRSFGRLFGADVKRLRTLSTRPKVIAEVGVAPSRRSRAGWIQDMFSWLSANPDVVSLTWWDRDQYNISQDPAAARAFGKGYRGWAA